MTIEQSLLTELRASRGGPFVTLLLQAKPELFSDKMALRKKLKNQVAELEPILQNELDLDTVRRLQHTAYSLVEKLELTPRQKGVGIYLAPNIQKLVSFPFAVKERVVVENSFDLTDVEKLFDRMVSYAVIILSKSQTRLFLGTGDELKEQAEHGFPEQYNDEFQVHRSSPYSFYNSEESKIDQARLNSFFRGIDQKLYPAVGDRPLLLIGVKRHLSTFKAVSKHPYEIIGERVGNFDKHSIHEITQLVTPLLDLYRKRELQQQ